MGTELARRGVLLPAPLWSAAALLTHPEVVRQIHADNATAGADILVANTFRTNPRTLRKIGMPKRALELTARAIELARSVAGSTTRRIIVAASVAPVEDCYRPELVPADGELRDEHGVFAEQIAGIGVDLIWVESMGTGREALIAAEAARSAGVDFAVSFLATESGNLLGGDSLSSAIAAILPFEPVAIGLNCAPPTGITRNLAAIAWSLRRESAATKTRYPAICAYGHIGNAIPLPGWSYAESYGPEGYLKHARDWSRIGATIIGGCCGTTPEHIRQLKVFAGYFDWA